MSIAGSSIPPTVYAWTAVLILPVNSALNPFLYTLSAVLNKNVRLIVTNLTLYSIDTHFDASTRDSFENIVEKEEIARNKQFFLFPQCFLFNQVIVSPFIHVLDIISLFADEFEEPKIGI